jgi:hypothetical protein
MRADHRFDTSEGLVQIGQEAGAAERGHGTPHGQGQAGRAVSTCCSDKTDPDSPAVRADRSFQRTDQLE